MRINRLIALVPLAALTACTSWQAERALTWVESAEIEQMLSAARLEQDVRFLAVCGRGCEIPGLDLLAQHRCSASGNVRIVDPTGDVIHSDRHLRLKDQVRTFAAEYNIRLAAELELGSQSTCSFPEPTATRDTASAAGFPA